MLFIQAKCLSSPGPLLEICFACQTQRNRTDLINVLPVKPFSLPTSLATHI